MRPLTLLSVVHFAVVQLRVRRTYRSLSNRVILSLFPSIIDDLTKWAPMMSHLSLLQIIGWRRPCSSWLFATPSPDLQKIASTLPHPLLWKLCVVYYFPPSEHRPGLNGSHLFPAALPFRAPPPIYVETRAQHVPRSSAICDLPQ